jgi:hypothetical protein
LEYQRKKSNQTRRIFTAVDFTFAILMLLVGSGLVWLCVHVLAASAAPEGVWLIVWGVMFFIGFSGCTILYTAIRIIWIRSR